jgi:hypothetical protein
MTTSAQACSNITLLEHVNLTQPDQALATLFYVVGLGLTRDPYMMVGLDNMWINIGRTQMHLPAGKAQRLSGRIHLLVPDLALVERSLMALTPRLAGTAFSLLRRGDVLEVSCPWGNRFVCGQQADAHAQQLGITAVEVDVAAGHAAGIARFYAEVLGAPTRTEVSTAGSPMAVVEIAGALPVAGLAKVQVHQQLRFVETTRPLPAYDGHHVQIYLADAIGPYERCLALGLITRRASCTDWRFVRIVDPADGRLLHELEHEIRDLAHPLFARPLVNRNPAQRLAGYRAGGDALTAD